MSGHPEAIIDSAGLVSSWDGLAPFLVPVGILWALVILNQIALKISRTREQRRRSDLETAHDQAAPVRTSR
ncbi:hypothetical protein HQO26_17445 [Rhodococcus fascians]|nr:hypothetical protein [Rhodococcus fascians]MBY4418792.1 hypothetical protein [Rhodococcus fascians]